MRDLSTTDNLIDDMVFETSAMSLAVENSILFFNTYWTLTRAELVAHGALDGYIRAHIQTPKGVPIQGWGLFAPSHAGKSTLIESYIRTRVVPRILEKHPEKRDLPIELLIQEQKTILHVTLTEDATPKSVAIDIIRRLDPAFATGGDKATLWFHVHRALDTCNVRLLVLDEVHHLAKTGIQFDSKGTAVKTDLRRTRSTDDALKRIFIEGSVPTLLVGTLQARNLLLGPTQFNGRLQEIYIPELLWEVDEDRVEFLTFTGRLAKAMHERGLLTEAPKLVYGDTPRHLFQASRGRLGRLCKILLQATILCLGESKTVLTRDHLASAVDIAVVSRKEIEANPFRRAVTPLELA